MKDIDQVLTAPRRPRNGFAQWHVSCAPLCRDGARSNAPPDFPMNNSRFPSMRIAALIAFLMIAGTLSIAPMDRSILDSRLWHRSETRATGALPDFVSIARRFDPSLVHIATVSRAVAAGAAPSPAGLGSGVILRADGYVITNDHVISNAEKIFVRLADRRELPARVVSRDERSDL